MGRPRGGIDWFSPDPRAIVPLDAPPAPPRSLRARIRSHRFEVRADADFEAVIRACGSRVPGRRETWINRPIIEAYVGLHRDGHAHSVEARSPSTGSLVGGLYGVAIGGVFFGESMFCRPGLGGTDASKVCFFHLLAHLRGRGYRLLDSQFMNEHIARLGAIDIPREEYLGRLAAAVDLPVSWGEFDPTLAPRSLSPPPS